MSTLGNLLGFKTPAAADSAPIQDTIQDLNRVPLAAPIGPPRRLPSPTAPDALLPDRAVVELDQELFFPIVTQLGEDNETVRNLLIDAEHKISELDAVKRSFNRLIDPVSKTLRSLEETKSDKLGLQTQLGNMRATYNTRCEELAAAEQRAAGLETECTQLRELVAVAQQRIGALEAGNGEQSAELATRRIQVGDMQRLLPQLTSDLQTSRDESERLAERVAIAEKRMVQLDAESQAARQRLQLAEKEKTAVNAMLDKAHANAAELSRKFADSETALTTAAKRLAQVELALNEMQAERTKLAAALSQATETYQGDQIALHARYESLQARAALGETMLEEARKTLTSRADEIGGLERRLAETIMARNVTETRLVEVERALIDRDDKIKQLEQTGSQLSSQNAELTRAVAARDTAHKSVQTKLRAQDELVKLLEHQLRAARQTNELQVEELNAQVQRERLERSMAEGALEAGRRDIARLLRELAAAQYRLPGFANDAAAPKAVPSAA